MELGCAPLSSTNIRASHPNGPGGQDADGAPPRYPPCLLLLRRALGASGHISSGQPCASRGVSVVSPALQAVSQGLMPPLQAGGSGAGGLCGCWVCCGRSGADWSWLCFTRQEKPSLGGRFLLSGAHP